MCDPLRLMSNAFYTLLLKKVYDYVELEIKLILYFLDLCNFYKNSTGQLSSSTFSSISEGAFLAEFPIDLFNFFKHQDIDSSSI